MQRHQQILAPKFALALRFSTGGWSSKIASWTRRGRLRHQPDVLSRYRQTHRRAGQDPRGSPSGGRGVVPASKDPEDKNIRIAPSFPTLRISARLSTARATCALLAATESLPR